ncbi:MAG: SRPBCC domain-containing protein [Candidatus Zixiibacteriota bacterium]
MANPFGHKIRQRTFINVPPEKVFDTITSADGWNAFFTIGLEVDPVVNGKMVWRWKDWGPDSYTHEVPGRVLIADRPKVFSFEWGSKRPTVVRFELEEKYGGTVVTCTEDGYDDSDKDRAAILECASGWGEAITLLKFYLEHGIAYTPPKK